jgi:glyoxylase-like metal-dependent hydrolase (beta-lactamase superfamily II)
MPSFSRRTLLAGSAALAGLGASGLGTAGFPAPAHAQAPNTAPTPAPAAGKQVPSAYRYKVGDVEITAIADGMRTFPLPPTFVRNQPPETVKAALKAAFLDEAQLSIPFNVLLLNIGGRRVLIDTGNGGEPGAVGQLRGTLGTLGVQPEMIDQIVISHFHADHINGLVLPDGTPAFPKAQVMVPEAEWAFWMDEGQMSRAPDAMKPSFQNVRRVFKPFAGKMERYAWDKEVAPGLKAVGTPGHTPGHTSFALESNFEEMFIQSDLTNIAALFIANPSWHVQFDMDAAKAAEVRKATLDRIAADRTRIAGYHFPFPAVAHLEKAGDGFRYVPVLWNPSSL